MWELPKQRKIKVYKNGEFFRVLTTPLGPSQLDGIPCRVLGKILDFSMIKTTITQWGEFQWIWEK